MASRPPLGLPACRGDGSSFNSQARSLLAAPNSSLAFSHLAESISTDKVGGIPLRLRSLGGCSHLCSRLFRAGFDNRFGVQRLLEPGGGSLHYLKRLSSPRTTLLGLGLIVRREPETKRGEQTPIPSLPMEFELTWVDRSALVICRTYGTASVEGYREMLQALILQPEFGPGVDLVVDQQKRRRLGAHGLLKISRSPASGSSWARRRDARSKSRDCTRL